MRRKLDDALSYGRQLQSVHDLQNVGNSASADDIVAILDVNAVDADAQPKKATLQALVEPTTAVKSNTAGITGSDQITNMVSLTQAEYDAIVSPSASTFYIITP
jgi:hypothetical protein